MQTYKVITETETATGTRTETATGLLAGDIDLHKEAARITATQGDTITHRVVAERWA